MVKLFFSVFGETPKHVFLSGFLRFCTVFSPSRGGALCARLGGLCVLRAAHWQTVSEPPRRAADPPTTRRLRTRHLHHRALRLCAVLHAKGSVPLRGRVAPAQVRQVPSAQLLLQGVPACALGRWAQEDVPRPRYKDYSHFVSFIILYTSSRQVRSCCTQVYSSLKRYYQLQLSTCCRFPATVRCLDASPAFSSPHCVH